MRAAAAEGAQIILLQVGREGCCPFCRCWAAARRDVHRVATMPAVPWLQELFEAPYFCQEQKQDYYRLAKVGALGL